MSRFLWFTVYIPVYSDNILYSGEEIHSQSSTFLKSVQKILVYRPKQGKRKEDRIFLTFLQRVRMGRYAERCTS